MSPLLLSGCLWRGLDSRVSNGHVPKDESVGKITSSRVPELGDHSKPTNAAEGYGIPRSALATIHALHNSKNMHASVLPKMMLSRRHAVVSHASVFTGAAGTHSRVVQS